MMNITNRPPETICVNDTEYPVDWDYRTWLDISIMLDDVDFSGNRSENIILVAEIISKAFGRIINEPLIDALPAVLEFMKGYPEADNGYRGTSSHKKCYSFRYDINYIIIAIRNQSGIDLSYRRKEPFHWWDFLLEFKSLTAEHYISKIMSYRAYDGKDKEMIKLREMYALPHHCTKSEQAIIDELDDIFYNS